MLEFFCGRSLDVVVEVAPESRLSQVAAASGESGGVRERAAGTGAKKKGTTIQDDPINRTSLPPPPPSLSLSSPSSSHERSAESFLQSDINFFPKRLPAHKRNLMNDDCIRRNILRRKTHEMFNNPEILGNQI